MIIIEKTKVQNVKWRDDPGNYDLNLHKLGENFAEFIIVNPELDNWVLECFDHSISSDKCLMWVRGDKWLAKKFKNNWSPEKGWEIIEVNFNSVRTNQVIIERNKDLPDLFTKPNYEISMDDIDSEHIWFLDKKYYSLDEVWVYKMRACERPYKTKHMGTVQPNILEDLDVIFISYDEENAEENWKKVVSKVPYAQRVHGVEGIFEAHKEAAKLAQTDMFWVVDGDAEILPNWKFNFQPNIFNRDCIHVWKSRNPINDLEYGYGGLKLFPKNLLDNAISWKVDMTTSIGSKLKVIDEVSNLSSFNTSPFATWRSAFRECAKLSANIENNKDNESIARLEVWTSQGIDRPFGKYALIGAASGAEYGKEHALSFEKMKLINSRQWLLERFNNEKI
jgi:hypothetical protein